MIRCSVYLTHNFKWAFLIFGLFCVLFLIWLAFSRWGEIKLGGPDDEAEFSTYAWSAMIFCAGIGIAIVYWAFIEPVYYLNSSTLHTDLESQEGLVGELAGVYGQFHWGITLWANYALPALVCSDRRRSWKAFPCSRLTSDLIRNKVNCPSRSNAKYWQSTSLFTEGWSWPR